MLAAVVGWSALAQEEPPEWLVALGLEGLELPAPPWPVPNYPIVTVPLGGVAPTLDGRIDLAGEWHDAVAVTGFHHRNLHALAHPAAQPLVLLKVDQEHLYVAMRSPIHPRGAQLRAFERVRGALEGILAGDHAIVEVLPLASRRPAVLERTGSLALAWNPIGTFADLHVGIHPGGMGQESWISGAQIADQVDAEFWQTEIRLPLAQFKSGNLAREIELPPRSGQYWSFGIARRFGRAGHNLFSTWVDDQTVFLQPYADQAGAWQRRAMLRFAEAAVAVQVRDLGDTTAGQFDIDLHFHNPGATDRELTVDICLQRLDGSRAWEHQQTVTVPAGGQANGGEWRHAGEIDLRGSRLFIRIVQDDGQLLHLTPGLPLVRFDDDLRTQYFRSLEMIR